MEPRTERPPKDKTQVTPEPARPDLFAFLERLFDGADQKPEKIELRQAHGSSANKYTIQLDMWEFKINQPKPQREQIVALSNKILDIAQGHCNALGKQQRYGVLARHYGKGDSPYAVHVIALKPKSAGAYDAIASTEEDEDGFSDPRRRDNLLQFSLEHLKAGDENERWRQQQFSEGVGDIIEKYQALVQQLMTQNLELQKEHRELFKTADEALSRKSERDLAAKMQDFKIEAMRDGLTFFKQMVPVGVNMITGKQTIPTKNSAESIAIAQFLEGLAEPQAKQLFGEIDTEKNELKEGTGIFTPMQAMIFARVAKCDLPPEALDQLFAGEHAVNEDQIARASQVVSAQQFMPLIGLLLSRKKKMDDQRAASASEAKPTKNGA